MIDYFCGLLSTSRGGGWERWGLGQAVSDASIRVV
jgi:hypothetical protein